MYKQYSFYDLPYEVIHKIYMINIRGEIKEKYQRKNYNKLIQEFNIINTICKEIITNENNIKCYFHFLGFLKKYNIVSKNLFFLLQIIYKYKYKRDGIYGCTMRFLPI